MKLAQEELQKSQKRYKKHYIMTRKKPRHLEVGDQVLILLLTESNKSLKQWRGAYIVESTVGAHDYRVEYCGRKRLQSKNEVQNKDIPYECVEEVYR